VEVIDPKATTGDTYEVTFNSLGKVMVIYDGTDTLYFDNFGSWNLKNINKNTMPIQNATAFEGLESDYFVVDGFRIGLTGSGYYEAEAEVLRREWIGGTEPYTGDGGYVAPEAGYLFFGSSIPGYDITQTVEIRFDRTKTSKGYLYLRGGHPITCATAITIHPSRFSTCPTRTIRASCNGRLSNRWVSPRTTRSGLRPKRRLIASICSS